MSEVPFRVLLEAETRVTDETLVPLMGKTGIQSSSPHALAELEQMDLSYRQQVSQLDHTVTGKLVIFYSESTCSIGYACISFARQGFQLARLQHVLCAVADGSMRLPHPPYGTRVLLMPGTRTPCRNVRTDFDNDFLVTMACIALNRNETSSLGTIKSDAKILPELRYFASWKPYAALARAA